MNKKKVLFADGHTARNLIKFPTRYMCSQSKPGAHFRPMVEEELKEKSLPFLGQIGRKKDNFYAVRLVRLFRIHDFGIHIPRFDEAILTR